jgi:hypothetical protein
MGNNAVQQKQLKDNYYDKNTKGVEAKSAY